MSQLPRFTIFGALLTLLLIFSTNSTQAEAVRLAIMVENQKIKSAADLLTASLSQNEQIELLEREQIEKVLREQKLSAAGMTGKDFLKLGQLLGADGLLLLDVSMEGTNSVLNARLVAVKQGVVLDFLQTLLPLADAGQFSEGAAKRFAPFFPKLTVLAKDAVPISILNLRSAARSTASTEVEREMTLLLINRLMRERDVFVLERRRMDALSSEKELQADESAFWSGSYLLEGVIDRDGFSREQITISARVSPPGGGAPMQIELVEKRGNLPALIDRLAREILASLKKTSSAPEWKPVEEAAQFFDEAKWALKWGMLREAQAAADSAWALGKRDVDCAGVRVQSYLADFVVRSQVYRMSVNYGGPGPDRKTTRTMRVIEPANPRRLDVVLHALNLYNQTLQTMPVEEPKLNSPWFKIGISALDAASGVLQHFYFVPTARNEATDKLGDLRALARAISARMLKPPSVREIYWLNGSSPNLDQFRSALERRPNIYRTIAEGGRFWNETLEDSITGYRELMSGEGYPQIRNELLERKLELPMLVAWNQTNVGRVSGVWEEFLRELDRSTNLALRIEGKFQKFADADADIEGEMEPAFEALCSMLVSNRAAIAEHPFELFQTYDLSNLVSRKCADMQNREKERIKERFAKVYDAQTRAMADEFSKEYWKRMESAGNVGKFAEQKKFIENNTPFVAGDFIRLFPAFFAYSEKQANELLPLVISYRSNVVVQMDALPRNKRGPLRSSAFHIGRLEENLKKVIEPPPPRPGVVARPTQTIFTTAPVQTTRGRDSNEPKFAPATNTLLVNRFFKIPFDQVTTNSVKIFSHRFSEGKLVLDLRFEEIDERYNRTQVGCAAIWNPQNETTEFIIYPPVQGHIGYIGSVFEGVGTGLHAELYQGAFYVADRQGILKHDFKTRRWEKLPVPIETAAQLFTVNDRLFAATAESIVELLDGGQSSRILASTRRRPVATLLDSLETLGKPIVFAGPNDSLRSVVGTNIYTWNGRDWSSRAEIPTSTTSSLFPDGVLFHEQYPYRPNQLWTLANGEEKPELSISEARLDPGSASPQMGFRLGGTTLGRTDARTEARWSDMQKIRVLGSAAALAQSNLYFYLPHVVKTNEANGKTIVQEKDGRHANLVVLDREFSKPLVIPLKFDLDRGPFLESGSVRGGLGIPGVAPVWLLVTPESLVIGHAGAAGFWIVSRTNLDSALATQKQIQRHGNLEKAAIAATRQKNLLAKYDKDGDGKFSTTEKVKMAGDPDWLQELWPVMDSNKNGFLDSEDHLELFDVNENGRAEPNEITLLDKIQSIVAAELLARFDGNSDGLIDAEEIGQISRYEAENSQSRRFYFNAMNWNAFDATRDGKLNQPELEILLQERTRGSLFATQPERMEIRMLMMRTQGRRLLEHEKLQVEIALTATVEELWRRKKTN